MGTVSFEVPEPGTYNVICDPKLDPLANSGTAGDILSGKQFYNDQNQVVTGTIATKGDSDVTADGPMVAVPPGYYPQAVNKTVSDPDLIPGNIKAGVDIFGVTGTLASQFAAVLVVTVDAGAEVTATDGTTTLTSTSTGTATFQLPNGGTWTVSATLNGSQSSPATVEVQENFSVALSAGATQTVNIPTQYEAELSFVPTYTITLTIAPAGSGTVTGAGEYQKGTQATVTAAPKDGYEFVAWKETVSGRLPTGYTELEYIQSSGTQYINTGWDPTTQTKTVLDLKITETANAVVFGSKVEYGDRQKQYFVYAMPAASRFEANYFYRTEANLLNLTDYKQRGILTFDQEALSFNGSTAALNYTHSAESVSAPIYLFGYNLDGSANSLIKMILYSCQIYEAGTLVRNFVPCSDPSGTIGLYDLVTNAFFANAGTGTFTAGPEAGGSVTVSTDNPYTFTVTENRALVAAFQAAVKGLVYYGVATPLSVALFAMKTATAGEYALFGGGYEEGLSRSAVVDAYDVSLTRTLPSQLSVAVADLAAAPVGDYALFAGGKSGSYASKVDAYDTALVRTSPKVLSEGRAMLAGAHVGNYALFAGGYTGTGYSSKVDAYNVSLTRTNPTSLSVARNSLIACGRKDYALFAGGGNKTVLSTVDAYNASLTRTVPVPLSTVRREMAATAVGEYALIGGGSNGSSTFFNIVDVYDASLTRITATPLSVARISLAATTVDGYALFGGGYETGYSAKSAVVDAYDESLTRTTPTPLSVARTALGAITIGNYALFGGGQGSSDSAVVDAYTVQ